MPMRDADSDGFDYRDIAPLARRRAKQEDVLDDGDRDGGQLEDADADAMDRWADAYDDLNGAPENDEDR